jgi:hypothetical protein
MAGLASMPLDRTFDEWLEREGQEAIDNNLVITGGNEVGLDVVGFGGLLAEVGPTRIRVGLEGSWVATWGTSSVQIGEDEDEPTEWTRTHHHDLGLRIPFAVEAEGHDRWDLWLGSSVEGYWRVYRQSIDDGTSSSGTGGSAWRGSIGTRFRATPQLTFDALVRAGASARAGAGSYTPMVSTEPASFSFDGVYFGGTLHL